MSTREFFAERMAAELPAFNKVIRAMPGDRLDYKPHERNTPAGALAWQLSEEMSQLSMLFATGEINFVLNPTPATVDEIADTFARNVQSAVDGAKAIDEERWASNARFLIDGKVTWETTVGAMAWGYLFDMIHHRGQLTAYLRPMGGKVPGCYGPSADES